MKPALIAAIVGPELYTLATIAPTHPVDVLTFTLYVMPARDFVFEL